MWESIRNAVVAKVWPKLLMRVKRGADPIKQRQVRVKHNLLAANQLDAVFDVRHGNK